MADHILLKTIAIFCCFLVLFTEAKTAKNKRHVPEIPESRLEDLSKWAKVARMYQEDPKMQRAIDYANWYHEQMDNGQMNDPRPPAIDIPAKPFTCNPDHGVSESEPQTVHELKPGDIDVIASFGDSITAGNGLGADNVLLVAVQNRGEAWSVGGDFSLEYNVTTLPNMIRKFNDGVRGYSKCTSGENDFEYAWFNVAVPGAKADDMPTQAIDMIDKMKNDDRVQYANDWKMITLFIGGNDFCAYCEDRDRYSPDNFIAYIQQALDMLHEEVPRAFVNLVPMADVSMVNDVYFHYGNTSYPDDPDPAGLYPWLCDVLHQIFCPCVLEEALREELKQVQLQYFDKMEELVDSGRYDTRDDFVVVLQPFLRDSAGIKDPFTGLTDNRYFAPDCFHPNRRMHQVMAFNMWNSMLTKVGEKPLGGDLEYWDDYVCPDENNAMFLYTKVNSQPAAPSTTPVSKATSIWASLATVITMMVANVATQI